MILQRKFTYYSAALLFIWACGGGGSSSPTEPVEPAPVANFTAAPTDIIQGQSVAFTSTSTGTISTYSWNVDGDAAPEGTAATFTHLYSNAGTFSVTLTVTGPGGSNSKSVADMITVTSAAPTPTTNASQTTQEDNATTISLTATDPNGEAVTFAITTNPTNGTATLSGADITYTPNANFYGTDSFDYTASNGTYTSDPVTITITVEGEDDGDPTTNDVSATTDEDTVVTVDLDASEIDGDNYSFAIISQPSNGTLGSINGNQVEYTPSQDWNGTDTFTFEATDDRTGSRSNVATATITVNSVNDAPVANDITSQVTDENRMMQLDITLNATDVEGDALTYSVVGTNNGTVTVNGATATYTPDSNWNGTDTFTYKANDGTDDSNTATVTVTVNAVNDAPIANDVSSSMNEDVATDITLDATDVDDGDTLTYSVVSAASNGTTAVSGNIVTYTPDANWSGSDTFTYKVNDGTVDSNTATVTITVNAVNDTPIATDVSAATNEDTALGVTLTSSDVEGDTLTYSVVGTNNGTVTISGSTATYTPTQDFNGTDTFTYKANDGNTDSNTATVTVTVNAVNDAPVANAMSVATDSQASTTLQIDLDVSDVDGDTLTPFLTATVSNGTLALITGTTSLVYNPTDGFSGTDTFVYGVNDGTVDSNTATVTITVTTANSAPAATDISGATNEDTAVNITLTATDVEGDALTYSIVGTNNGTVTLSGATATYTPDANWNGTDTFTYKANDGTVDSNTATVTVNVASVNDAPVANDVTASMDENRLNSDNDIEKEFQQSSLYKPVNITLTATDVEGDTLTYSVVGTNNGTVTISGSTATYTPTQDFNGTDTFTYKANDGNTDSNTATVTVTVNAVNDAPVANAMSVATDSQASTTLQIDLDVSDVDGDTLTPFLTATVSNGTLALITGTTSLVYNPTDGFSGTDTFVYGVNDGTVDSNTATVTITVTSGNNAPVTSSVSGSTNEDVGVSVTLNGSDSDGNALTYSLVTNPSNGTATISGATLSYTPNQDWAGVDTFTYKANDGTVDSNTSNIQITVNNLNPDAVTLSTLDNKWNGSSLQLSWSQSAESYFAEYRVYEDDDPNFQSATLVSQITDISTTSYNYSATPGTKNYYLIQVVDQFNGGTSSNVQQADTFWRFEFSYSTGNDIDNIGSKIIPVSTGGYIIVGSSCDLNGTSCDGTIYKIDEYGQPLWVYSTGEGNYDDFLVDAYETTNGDIIAVGSTLYTTGWGSDILYARLTSSGSEIYTVNIDWDYDVLGDQDDSNGSTDYGLDLIEDTNGDIYIAGGTSITESGTNLDPFMLRLSDSGSGLSILGSKSWDDIYDASSDAYWVALDHSPNVGDEMSALQIEDGSNGDGIAVYGAYFNSDLSAMTWVSSPYTSNSAVYVYDTARYGDWHAMAITSEGSAGYEYENVGWTGDTQDFKNVLNNANSPSYNDMYARTLTLSTDNNYLVSGFATELSSNDVVGMFGKSLTTGGFEYAWAEKAHTNTSGASPATYTQYISQAYSTYDGGILIGGHEYGAYTGSNGYNFYFVKYDSDGYKVQLDMDPGRQYFDSLSAYRSSPKRAKLDKSNYKQHIRYDGLNDIIGENILDELRESKVDNKSSMSDLEMKIFRNQKTRNFKKNFFRKVGYFQNKRR